MTISLEEAIQTAIKYENKVLKVYTDATGKIIDSAGLKIFRQLAKEEAGHVAYLQSRLAEWQKTGHIELQELRTAVPNKERIAEGLKGVSKSMRGTRPASSELEHLRRALEVEKETSAFYQRMVSELSGEQRKLFARFLEIEDGHVAIVQAEIDSITGCGYWFDVKEFDLEMG
jgi:rubrerythrin